MAKETTPDYSASDPTELFIAQCRARSAARAAEVEISKAVIEKGAKDAPQGDQDTYSGVTA